MAVLFSLLLVLYLLAGLLAEIFGDYADEIMSQGSLIALIVVLAAALLCALAALRIAVGRLRGRGGSLAVMFAWQMLTALLIAVGSVISLASGPS